MISQHTEIPEGNESVVTGSEAANPTDLVNNTEEKKLEESFDAQTVRLFEYIAREESKHGELIKTNWNFNRSFASVLICDVPPRDTLRAIKKIGVEKVNNLLEWLYENCDDFNSPAKIIHGLQDEDKLEFYKLIGYDSLIKLINWYKRRFACPVFFLILDPISEQNRLAFTQLLGHFVNDIIPDDFYPFGTWIHYFPKHHRLSFTKLLDREILIRVLVKNNLEKLVENLKFFEEEKKSALNSLGTEWLYNMFFKAPSWMMNGPSECAQEFFNKQLKILTSIVTELELTTTDDFYIALRSVRDTLYSKKPYWCSLEDRDNFSKSVDAIEPRSRGLLTDNIDDFQTKLQEYCGNPRTQRVDMLDLFSCLKEPTGAYKMVHQKKNHKLDHLRLLFKSNRNHENPFWHTISYQNAIKTLQEAYSGKPSLGEEHERLEEERLFLEYKAGNHLSLCGKRMRM